MLTEKYTTYRGDAIQETLDMVYDMLQEIEGMPEGVLHQVIKLQARLDNEFADLATRA